MCLVYTQNTYRRCLVKSKQVGKWGKVKERKRKRKKKKGQSKQCYMHG
eukprot:jgi/Antlo1/1108/2415